MAAPARCSFPKAWSMPRPARFTLRARFPNSQGLLLPGMYVRATLSQATVANAILVPQAAVSRDPRGGATVLVVGPGNKAVRKPITADRTVGDRWLVTAGLEPGERVIVEGLIKVKAGQPVVPTPAGIETARAGRTGQPRVISRVFIDRPIFAWVISIVIMLAGIGGILSLPVEQYPDIAPTTISVRANYPGAAAETVESSVTQVDRAAS